jgi:DNA-directed RNA polymerase subunit H (RpoH/RPB5)
MLPIHDLAWQQHNHNQRYACVQFNQTKSDSPVCHNVHQHVNGYRVISEERAARNILGMSCQPALNSNSNSPVCHNVHQHVDSHRVLSEEGAARDILCMCL